MASLKAINEKLSSLVPPSKQKKGRVSGVAHAATTAVEEMLAKASEAKKSGEPAEGWGMDE